MRIVQINANYGFTSTGLIMKDISDTIEAHGNESYPSYQRTGELLANGYRIGNPLDWKIHALLCRLFGAQGYYSWAATRSFERYLKKIEPDIVHLHNLHSNYINIDMLLRFLAKEDIATVITMHDCWWFTGKCFHYADCGCSRFMTGCGKCPKMKAPPASMLFDRSRWSLRNKAKRLSAIPRLRLVGCSKWVCDEGKKGILKDFTMKNIYNGVDTSVFKPCNRHIREKFHIRDQKLILGMANKWLLPSNIEMLDIVGKLPGIRLMIVGCTESQQKMMQEHYPNVISVGFINNRKELAEYYSAADAFVNLTHADTLPTVNMESICCGTPVITYDSCGSPELITPETGVIIPENDTNGIVKAFGKIDSFDRERCSAIGMDKFDKNRCYEAYIQMYEELVK